MSHNNIIAALGYPYVRVLLIEDNPGDIRLIQELLKEVMDFNHEVVATSNLAEGLRLIEEEKFDVVLLDLTLPDSSGFETLFKTRETSKNIPIVVLTGLNDDQLARKAVQAGAQDYLVKGQIYSNPLVRSIYHAIDRYKMMLTIESLAETVQENEFRLKNIIDKIVDSIIIVDRERNVCFANPAALIYFGNRDSDRLNQLFGSLPVFEGNLEINFSVDGIGKVAEISSVEIIWEGQIASLLNIRDITERREIENARMEVDKIYRELFENSLNPLLILRLNGEIENCNPKFEQLIGYSRADLKNKKYWETSFIIKEFQPQFQEIMENLKTNQITDQIEIKTISQNGRWLWLKLHFSLMNLQNEKMIYILIQDITKIKKSEQEVEVIEQVLKEMEALIENAPLAVFLIHPNGKILRVNENAKKLFQFDSGEFLNLMIFDLFDKEYLNQAREHYENDIYLTNLNKFEATIITKQQKVLEVEISSTLIRGGDNLIIQSFFSDITERKVLEKHKELLLDQLITSLEFKSQFLAAMSHELRTPLNAILGFSELLMEESYGGLNAEQRDFIEDINSAGNHLLSVVNNVLDFSKMEAGKFILNKKEFPLLYLIVETQSIFKPMYSKKGLEFEIEGIKSNVNIYADPLRFKQILYNLIDNAIKFTEEGTITFKGIERTDHWEFLIKDTGGGIAKEDYEVVFREFERVESDVKAPVSGSGLGLALTKRLVHLHEGEIWFESDYGKGTSFYFTIPKKMNEVN